MILCSRCDFVGHVTGLLEHWDAVHGGWSVRVYETVPVKPMEPNRTRLEERLARHRRQAARTKERRDQRRRSDVAAGVIDFGVAP